MPATSSYKGCVNLALAARRPDREATVDLRKTLPSGEAWTRLYTPVLALVEETLPQLSLRLDRPPLTFAGPRSGPWAAVEDDRIALSSALLEGGTHTPEDAAWAERWPEVGALALDRWRRAAGALLEGHVLLSLREQDPAGDPGSWWRVGVAAERVDRAEPTLGWIWPELADLRRTGEPGLEAHPRSAAWLVRWLRLTRGLTPTTTAPTLDDEALAAFGAWIRDPRGPCIDAPLPLPLGEPSRESIFVAMPLSFRALALSTGPAGARAQTSGAALCGPLRVASEEALAGVAGTLAGGLVTITLAPSGPTGTWALNTGVVQERVGAARGVELELKGDGRLEIVLADAFMGLPTTDMLALAESVGVSGWAGGRWRVLSVAPTEEEGGELLLEQVKPKGLTLHPRGGHGYAVPAASVIRPAEQILTALSGATFRWRPGAEGMTLTGQVMGVSVELRFRKA